MPFAVLPALIPDIRAIYDTYFSAFSANPQNALLLDILFPGGQVNTPEFRQAHVTATVNWWHTSTDQFNFKCIDTDTGEIVGMALMDIYLNERSDEQRKNPGVIWLQGEERERAEKIVNPLEEMREKIWGGRPYICTSMSSRNQLTPHLFFRACRSPKLTFRFFPNRLSCHCSEAGMSESKSRDRHCELAERARRSTVVTNVLGIYASP